MSKNKKYELSDIDLDTAVEALSYCDYDDRDNWLAIGMALKSEFGEEAFNDFDRWSQQYDKYESATVLSVWKSFKKSGINIGTLINEALSKGFKFDKKVISKPDLERLKIERKTRRNEIKKKQAEDEQNTFIWRERLAEFLWSITDCFHNEGPSEYLKQKKVAAFGLLFSHEPILIIADQEKDLLQVHKRKEQITEFFKSPKEKLPKHRMMIRGHFAVPVVDIHDQLWNLQIIQGNSWKSFFPGRKKGCFHIIGAIPAVGRFNIGLTEGYANGACIHMATELPVVVAFDSGNMKAVAIAIKNKYGDRISCFVFFADDDKHLEKQGKNNTGMKKAVEAAKAVNGLVISPTIDIIQDVGDTQSKEEKTEIDCLYNEAADFIIKNQKATTSGVQRHLKIGYNRTAKILDQLETGGVVGAKNPKGRKVLKSAIKKGSDNG